MPDAPDRDAARRSVNPLHGTLRLACPDEAGLLRNLVRAAYAHYVPRLGREPAPMTDDYAARITAGQAWLLEANGAPIGALVLEDTSEGLLIDNIAVSAEARGTGLGRRLMAFAEDEARRHGHARLWLYTNEKMTENIALYTRLGYRETRRAEQDGHRRVFMEKPLSP
jgi:GNAT superfamily N-acetyltransferase